MKESKTCVAMMSGEMNNPILDIGALESSNDEAFKGKIWQIE